MKTKGLLDSMCGHAPIPRLVRKMAEREGFEPPVPCGTPDFESKAGMLSIKGLQTVERLCVGRWKSYHFSPIEADFLPPQ